MNTKTIQELAKSYEIAMNDDNFPNPVGDLFGTERHWSSLMAEKYNVESWLGSSAMKDLKYIWSKRGDYDLLFMITKVIETETYYEDNIPLSKKEILDKIARIKERLEWTENTYYVCVRFKTSIKEHFYPGDDFLRIKENMSIEEGVEMMFATLEDNGVDNFFPTLQEQIHSFIKGRTESDFYDFGSDDFAFYWTIEKDKFNDFKKTLFDWIRYEQLEEYFLYVSNDNAKYKNGRIWRKPAKGWLKRGMTILYKIFTGKINKIR